MPSRCDHETARSMCRAHSCSLRAFVVCVVKLVDVICVMIVVLIAHVDVVRAVDTVFVAIFVAIFCTWRCTLYRPKDSALRNFVSMSAGFSDVSDVPTFATPKSFLETAHCTHKYCTLICLVLPNAPL